jgi:hypothetical protein
MGAYIEIEATASASRVKSVHCHWCATDFTYVQSGQATGQATQGWWNFWRDNAARARSKARANLDAALANDAPAACPTCGKFQPSMFSALRQTWAAQHTWKPIAAVGVATVLIGLFWPRKASVGGFFEAFLDRLFEFDLNWIALIGAAIAANVAIHVIASRIDPNRSPARWTRWSLTAYAS